jgi:hypothetical protein
MPAISSKQKRKGKVEMQDGWPKVAQNRCAIFCIGHCAKGTQRTGSKNRFFIKFIK